MSSATSSSSRRVDRSLVVIEALVGVGVLAAIVGKTYGAASTIMFLLAAFAATFSGLVLVRMVTALRDETLDVPGRVIDTERQELETEKTILLHGIKEFEADAAQGKVDRQDYDHLRRTAEARALQIIQELKAKDDAYLERAEHLIQKRVGAPSPVTKRRPETTAPDAPSSAVSPSSTPAAAPPKAGERIPAGLFIDEPSRFTIEESKAICSVCSTENDEDARYCIGCGRPRSEVSA